jgi:hypothetical protein
MREFDIRGRHAENIFRALEDAKLLEKELSLVGILRSVHAYAKQLIKLEAFETGMTIDPATQMPSGLVGRIVLREPSSSSSMPNTHLSSGTFQHSKSRKPNRLQKAWQTSGEWQRRPMRSRRPESWSKLASLWKRAQRTRRHSGSPSCIGMPFIWFKAKLKVMMNLNLSFRSRFRRLRHVPTPTPQYTQGRISL